MSVLFWRRWEHATGPRLGRMSYTKSRFLPDDNFDSLLSNGLTFMIVAEIDYSASAVIPPDKSPSKEGLRLQFCVHELPLRLKLFASSA